MFLAYHDGQPFNENMFRSCPMLENPGKLQEMVEKSGARSTDMQSPEPVENLTKKCQPTRRTGPHRRQAVELLPQVQGVRAARGKVTFPSLRSFSSLEEPQRAESRQKEKGEDSG